MLKNNFKLYQHREVGFGAHFKIVLCLIDYCIDNNIKCEIDIRNTTYSNINQNTWELIFDQPFSDVNPKLIVNDQFSEVPKYRDYWNLGYESHDRQKYDDKTFVSKYRNICKNFIKINQSVLDEVDDYCKKFSNKKVLGIHKRGREHLTTGHAKGQEHLLPLKKVFTLIDDHIENYDYVFLTSDETQTYDQFKLKYGDKLLIFDNKSQYIDSKLDINYLQKTDEEKINSLKNLIIEVLILSRCDKLLLMNSNVSHMALFFSEIDDFQFYDTHLNYN